MQVDEWLEFESSQLSATILNGFNTSGKIDSNSRALFVKQLALLDNALSGKAYLVGVSHSFQAILRIIIW